METIDRLKQILLVYRTEDISKLTFEERMEYDNAFTEEIVKLFPIHNVSGSQVYLVGDLEAQTFKLVET